MSSPGRANPAPELGHRLAHTRAQLTSTWAHTTETWAHTTELRQQAERVLAEAQAIQQAITDARRERRASPAGRGRLQRSDYDRLLARLETMPVIEQAKGIIMAQSRCGEAEAFDTLRRASQRSNVPVRDLAARIVAHAAETDRGPDTQGHASRNAGGRQ